MKKNIQVSGIRLSYSLKGSGPAVMFLHGFAEDGRIWDKITDTLASKYLVIIPDLPGSGESEYIDKEDIGLNDYAQYLYELTGKENIEKLTLIGHSMGGYIALAFAEKYPDKLYALGLFHSSAFADDNPKIEIRKKGIEFIRTHGAHAFLKTSIPGLFYDQAISEQDISLLIGRAKAFEAEALIQYYEAMINRPDRTGVLRNLERPLLIIAGKHDKAVPLEASLQQTHIPTSAYLHILKKSAHMGMLEEKEESEKILAVFLENSQSMF